MGRPNFGQSQLTNRSGRILKIGNQRQESGAVHVGKHDDLHGDGLFSMAKSIFKSGSKALKSAKKFAKSDLVKKGIKYGKKYGKQAIDLGSKAAELYGSETGQAIKQALLPSDTPGFVGEKHAILDRGGGRGYVGANYMGPGTNVKKRLQRGDVGITPVDMLAMKHDVAYRKAQGAKSKADQLRMVRKADEDMVAGLRKIVALGADNPMNIKQAQLIIAKLAGEKMGVISKGSFGGELEKISKEEMNLLNKAETGLTQMGYGKKHHPASHLKKQLARKHKKGKGLKLAGQGLNLAGQGLKVAGQGHKGGRVDFLDPLGKVHEMAMKNKISNATDYANREAKKGKNWKAAFAKVMNDEDDPWGIAPLGVSAVGLTKKTRAKKPPKYQKLGLVYKGNGKQSGGFVFTIAALIAAASSAAAAAAAAAPTITAIGSAVAATAGAAVAVKELVSGEGLKTVIAKKIKEEIKNTKVSTRDLPKNIIKAADKKLKIIKNLKVPVKEKKEMVIKQVAKPLIPLVKKKYVEKLAKNLKGNGLKLAGQGKGKGLNLAGQGNILTDKKILDGMKKETKL